MASVEWQRNQGGSHTEKNASEVGRIDALPSPAQETAGRRVLRPMHRRADAIAADRKEQENAGPAVHQHASERALLGERMRVDAVEEDDRECRNAAKGVEAAEPVGRADRRLRRWMRHGRILPNPGGLPRGLYNRVFNPMTRPDKP